MRDQDKTKELLINELEEMRRQTAETDITARKETVDSLRMSEERYRRLVESVTDYIYTVKVENGFPVSTLHGPGCVAVTGYTSEKYEADPNLWYRMVYEEDRKAVIGQSVNVLSGKYVQQLEHRIIHRDGSIRWVRNIPVPKYDEHGRLIAYDGLVSDITERRKLEEQLRHSQKMEVVGTLAGGIAHDFNNILTAMMGYANLLQMEIKSDEPASHHAGQILVMAEKAANLTQGLLAFSRKQIINPKPTDVDGVIKRVEKILRRLIGEDIELKVILAGKRLAVMVDSGQIEQVLMNLCVNARDAMPDGGSLTIETEIMELDSEYIKKHGYGELGHYLLVSVTDTGTGIDEKTKERVFEPFFTTKELGKGTGLGLSTAYGIIKQHNGYINVSSELGKGARFDIYLPVVKSPLVEEKKYAGQVLPLGGEEIILYAEDELFLREVTKEVFEEFGYKVIVAVDGEDAIDKFMKHRDDIDLLLLDAIMPKKNGKEVYMEIRKVRPDIKAIFLSGYSTDVIQNKGIHEEGLTLISKPISPTILVKKIREVLDK
ncbi:MAG: ATP-binding protein [Deltaproteobacteria bacterium]|nr:ATP-binding protein [Deltaproteobacteria bacterium]